MTPKIIIGFLLLLSLTVLAYPKDYYCGDLNADGKIDVSDVVYGVSYLIKHKTAPVPDRLVADVNCDGKVNIADVVYLISYVFKKGNPPCDTNGDGICDCHS